VCSDAPSNSFHYAHGVGLNTMSLFLQSNMGIVTAAVVKLIPKPERLVLVEADFASRDIVVRASCVLR
jgi:4-cresol dehydrogenase (hydroxylating) flavoprotein subunit